MKAELLLRERYLLSENAFVEARIWRLPAPVRGSSHSFKYSFAYIVDGACVLRYDNEAGKGDHRHVGVREERYQFTGVEQLAADFWSDVRDWRR
ncbi:toxin-antitoxin system TumE family protein [Terrarubrum flagellatum]|uniref:toxin-antitoxin system TumE family protein n=1 Tax=Terrirubrum flagellatum TaxID=2895980 RepID=UPI0031452E0D